MIKVSGQKVYLIIVGNIQRDSPSCAGRMRMLAPGTSIHIDNQTSPRTLAKEVKMSANMTSEKYIGRSAGANRHLRIELHIMVSHTCKTGTNINLPLKKHVTFTFVDYVERTYEDNQNTQGTNCRNISKNVDQYDVPVGHQPKGSPCNETPYSKQRKQSIDRIVHHCGIRYKFESRATMSW